MNKQVTIRDISSETGFSFQTVSRVLSGKGHLHKPATVKKIEKAAKDLGYVPNLFAKGMQSGRTRSIGLIIDPFLDRFTQEIFRGAHDALLERDYLPILLMHRPDLHDEQHVQRLAERRVEGLIIRPYPTWCEEVAAAVGRHQMPVVSVDYTLPGDQNYDFVGTEDELGGQQVAEYLLELGHRTVAGVYYEAESLQLRKRGFEQAVSAHAEAGPPVAVEGWAVGYDEENLARIKELLSRDPAPTALFAGGDFMLPVIYRAISEAGLRIPEDISVMGFGDEEFCGYMSPPATTMQQDAYKIGAQAVQLLIKRIEGGDRDVPARQLRFEPSLKVHESTAPPAR